MRTIVLVVWLLGILLLAALCILATFPSARPVTLVLQTQTTLSLSVQPSPDSSILITPIPSAASADFNSKIATPPINTPTPASTLVPTLGYRLLFLRSTGANSSELILWSQTDYEEILVTEDVVYPYASGPVTKTVSSDVQQYSVSADGQTASVHILTRQLKDKNIPSNPNILLNEIGLLDLQTHEYRYLVQFGDRLAWSTISPNGQWVAYVLDLRENKMAREPIVVEAINTKNPEQRLHLGNCLEWCKVVWSPDGQRAVWSDVQGIWMAQIDDLPAQLLRPDMSIPVSDGRMGVYQPMVWTSNSKFLLASTTTIEDGMPIIRWHVVNIQTGQVMLIPNAFPPPFENARLSWMQDNRLFVVRYSDKETQKPSIGEVWRIDGSDKNQSLQLDYSFVISDAFDTYPIAPTQLNDGRLALVLVSKDNTHSAASGLYIIDPQDNVSTLGANHFVIAPNPSDVNAIWIPNGLGVISVYLPNSTVSFVSYDSPGIRIPLTFGTCCFTWIE